MIDPKTSDAIIATQVLALADTIGHGLTHEEIFNRASEYLVELNFCTNGDIKSGAIALSERLKAYGASSNNGAVHLAPRLSEATEHLRNLLLVEIAA